MAEPEETCVFEHETSIPGLLTLHRDGTITRLEIPQGELDVPPSPNSKDLVLTAHVKARLFLPTESPSRSIKLPLILFFHGGGFVSLSYASPGCHSLCNELAVKTHAIVVSVGYRLAPEHRLPAAFEDGFSALLWLKGQALCEPNCEPWLASYADFTKVFIAGVSSGASIVHQVALQAAAAVDQLKPQLDVRGLVLVVPFLGGQVRTQSEVELEESSTLPLQGCDNCWALSLPKGASRDHPFSNVMGPQAPRMDDSMAWPPSLLVVGGRDILHDRQLEYAQKLQEAGKEVNVARFEHGDHFMSGHFHDLMVEEITKFVLYHSP